MAIFNLLASNIENLELKLEGKLPIDRDELFALVNSWGRSDWFYIKDKNEKLIKINSYEENEKYDLSKLDVSKITDFSFIFEYSNFNGDINSWDVSNGTSMDFMFDYTKEFNSPLDKWNTSNVTSMENTFSFTENFNQNLNSWDITKVIKMNFIFEEAKAFNQPLLWDISNVKSCNNIFYNSQAFKKRFNNKYSLPRDTKDIKEWLLYNKELMVAINIEENKGKELDQFLLNFDVIVSKKLNGLHDIITSTKLNGLHNNMEIDNGNI